MALSGIRKDYTGFRKFGSRLVVLGMHQWHGRTYALCRCDCGALCLRVMARVKNGDCKSCDCLQPRYPRRRR